MKSETAGKRLSEDKGTSDNFSCFCLLFENSATSAYQTESLDSVNVFSV